MKRKRIIIGMPVCLGAPLAGCAKGPDVIRKQLSAEQIDFEDLGDLVKSPTKCKSKKCNKEIGLLHKVAKAKLQKLKIFTNPNTAKKLPILIGGDHSMSLPFIQESAKQTKLKTKSELGLIWFDAHGDFNTPETSITGNIHGMVLSELADATIKEENICIFGVRDLDPKEEALLKTTKVKIITATTIKKIGIPAALKLATKKMPKRIHLSFDLDVFDPRTAPGVNTQSIKGLSQKHLNQILEFFKKYKAKKITSIDIMEFNPNKDQQNKTAKIAAKLIAEMPL